MSLTIQSVNLIRKTDIPLGDADSFLQEALVLCTGSDPGMVTWQQVSKMTRGRSKGEELTITDSWQPGPMVDVRRTRVESHNMNIDGEMEISGSRTSYAVRGLNDEGSMEFRVDNTRLKGASLEVYASAEAATGTADLFRERFSEK